MALAPRPTFAIVAEELLVNLGKSVAGNHSAPVMKLATSWLTTAHALLFREAEWIRLLDVFDIPLIEDQREYDIPDGLDPSRINNYLIVRADDSMEFDLGVGIRPNERNAARAASNRPLRIEVLDQQFRLWPAPDATWSTLRLEGIAIQSDFADPENDRIAVDKTALLLKATILGKIHYGMPGVDQLRAELFKYLDDVRAAESDGDGIQLGGPQAAAVENIKQRNRITRGRSRARNNNADFAPWD